jgi:hypothetical protein
MTADRDEQEYEDDDSLRIDASEIAPLLGLTPERLMAELRAGQIYHIAEEPDDDEDHDSRMRIVFRYRARIARLIVEPDGSMHPEFNRTH